MKRAVGISLERLLGLAFLVPALLKALDMDAFATQILKYHVLEDHGAIRTAAWITLACEALIAALLLLPARTRWLSHGLALGMLTVFTGLIAYAWAFHGLTDCGCFGKYIAMTPAQSIAKNLVMIAVSLAALWLLRGESKAEPKPHNSLAAIASAAAAIAIGVLAVGSNDLSAPASTTPADGGEAIDERPFAKFVFEDDVNAIDLGVGAHLVAFYSASCEHCMSTVPAANELAIMPDFPPFVALLYGKEDDIKKFNALTNPEFPTIGWSVDMNLDPLTFHDYLRDPAEGATVPPRFFYIVDGEEVARWDSHPPTVEEFISTYPEAVGG